MTSNTDGVSITVDDGIARVTLDRPQQRNALSLAVSRRLHDFWLGVDDDPAIAVILLGAASCGTFCAGLDLKEAAKVRAEQGVDVLTLLEDPFHLAMGRIRKPIVGAINGDVTAGGLMLALNCDLRVGLAGSRLAISEAQRGRGSPWAVPLLWQLPQAVLSELVLTGDWLPADRLCSLGFYNSLEASAAAVDERALAYARRVRDNAPLSVRAAKESLRQAQSLGREAGLAAAVKLYEPVYASEDAIEGPRAFAEKRPPVWKGR